MEENVTTRTKMLLLKERDYKLVINQFFNHFVDIHLFVKFVKFIQVSSVLKFEQNYSYMQKWAKFGFYL